MNKSLHAMLKKICTCRGDPSFHNCYDGIIARKKVARAVHLSSAWTDGNQKTPNLDCVVGAVDSPAKTDSVLHDLQTEGLVL